MKKRNVNSATNTNMPKMRLIVRIDMGAPFGLFSGGWVVLLSLGGIFSPILVIWGAVEWVAVGRFAAADD